MRSSICPHCWRRVQTRSGAIRSARFEVLNDVMRDMDDDPTAFEIRAAAYAMLGKFTEAQKDQRKALKMAQQLGWETASQQARLASYAASKPWTGDLFAF